MQFSAVLNMFIVKTYLNCIFTNDLKRKDFFSKMFKVTEYAALIYYYQKLWKHLGTQKGVRNNHGKLVNNVRAVSIMLLHAEREREREREREA